MPRTGVSVQVITPARPVKHVNTFILYHYFNNYAKRHNHKFNLMTKLILVYYECL